MDASVSMVIIVQAKGFTFLIFLFPSFPSLPPPRQLLKHYLTALDFFNKTRCFRAVRRILITRCWAPDFEISFRRF